MKISALACAMQQVTKGTRQKRKKNDLMMREGNEK